VTDDPTDGMTLEEAREWLRKRIDKGAKCPCCRQFVKVYRRKLNSSMARALIHFYTHSPTQWFHADTAMKTMPGSRGDYVKLAYWSLIESKVDQDPDARAGWWRVTSLGRKFVLNDGTTVDSHAVLYDGIVLRRDGDPISIVAALGRHFNYNELMAERPFSLEPQ